MLVEIGDGTLHRANPEDPEGPPLEDEVRVLKLRSPDGLEVQAVLTYEQAEKVGDWLKTGKAPGDPASVLLGNGGPALLG